jgi:ribosome-binding factor A
MNERTKARLESRIKETVASVIIRDLRDPRLGFVTVTGVDLSVELDIARVKVSILGDEKATARSLQALNGARGFLQEAVGRVLETRRTPRLEFVLDESVAHADHVAGLIRRAREEDEAAARERGEPPAVD